MAAIDTSGQRTTAGVTGQMNLLELQNLHRQAKGVRDRFIPDWYLNLAFYLGQQWLYWNRGRLDKPRLASWRRTPVDNRIMPIVTARAARKVKNRPAFICTPFTADEADIESARLGERVLDSDWVGLNLQDKLYQAILFAEITGAGFWKIYWDSTRGKSAEFLFDAMTGQPVAQANGQPVRADAFGEPPAGLEPRQLAEGDVCVDVLSPWEIFPDPLAKTLEECEWVIEEKVRSVEYVKKRYGVTLPADAGAPIGPVEARLFSTLTWSAGEAEEYKGVKVYEYWSRPSTTYPNGWRCVWAGDEMLHEEEPIDPMPYVMFSGIKAPNRFWPSALTTQLRGPNTELNKVKQQIAENGMRFGNLSLMTSRHANVEYSGVPGERVYYDSTVPDAVPSFLAPPEMPSYVERQIEQIETSMVEISGLHEVSKASVPAGVTAASAINLLQEADDTRIGPEIQDMEVVLGQAGTKVLRLRAKFNSEERLVRIAGEDGNWDIFSFRGQMLGDDPNVEVQAGSSMPRSKAAKQAAMLEVLGLAFQYGIEFDPRDLRRFFKDYEVGGIERLFESISSDESQVQRENRMMTQGEAVNINDWDMDDIHVAGHDEYRKSARFAKLPPPIQIIFDTHIRAHKERQVQVVNQQLMVGQQEGLEQEALAQEQAQQAAPPGG